jgi:hypothetical protein
MTTDNPIEPELIVAAIDAAEELRDPLDGLVERATIDPGARRTCWNGSRR